MRLACQNKQTKEMLKWNFVYSRLFFTCMSPNFKNLQSTLKTGDRCFPQLSMQFRFANLNLDFRRTYAVILLSVTWTLDNSNLPLTQSSIHFPSGHFLYNFTLDLPLAPLKCSVHGTRIPSPSQWLTALPVITMVQFTVLMLFRLCYISIYTVILFYFHSTSQFNLNVHCMNRKTPNTLFSLFLDICSQPPITGTPKNSNLFQFPFEIWVTGSTVILSWLPNRHVAYHLYMLVCLSHV